jgi:hypothetical protein
VQRESARPGAHRYLANHALGVLGRRGLNAHLDALRLLYQVALQSHLDEAFRLDRLVLP